MSDDEELPTVADLEARLDALYPGEKEARIVTVAREMLGVTRSTYYDWRTGARPTPEYIRRSIRVHLRISDRGFRWLTIHR